VKLEPRADVRTMGCGSLTRCQRMGMGTVEWTQSTRNQFLDTQPVSVWFLFYSTLMYIDDHWCTLCTVCTVNTPCFGWPLHVRQTSTVQSRSWSCALWSLEMKWNEAPLRFPTIPFDSFWFDSCSVGEIDLGRLATLFTAVCLLHGWLLCAKLYTLAKSKQNKHIFKDTTINQSHPKSRQ